MYGAPVVPPPGSATVSKIILILVLIQFLVNCFCLCIQVHLENNLNHLNVDLIETFARNEMLHPKFAIEHLHLSCLYGFILHGYTGSNKKEERRTYSTFRKLDRVMKQNMKTTVIQEITIESKLPDQIHWPWNDFFFQKKMKPIMWHFWIVTYRKSQAGVPLLGTPLF